ncbi:hypothetical protein SCHPADRAFT_995598 [Schizopora paradoxa]|uniref:HMG box domain-containing protein n=1 Tax=Schizopora paradoxa TaxID=27342 RepID=A0A0H2RVR3_9AGAM|nr:hypothetical protein SCHPADRAFT_995598 [Schizopora paradoxa]
MQDAQQLELQRLQLISVLNNAADSLRTAASMADGFASTLQHTSFAQQNANTMNPMSMFQSFAQMFGANGALGGGESSKGQFNLLNQATSAPAQQDNATPTATSNGKDHAHSSSVEKAPADGEEGKKRKRGVANPEKKKRDPNMPKKPASAYILFQNDVREEIRKQNPDQPYAVVLNKISEAWAALTDEQKKPYNDLVHKNKADYDIRKGEYEAKLAGSHIDAPTSPEEVIIPETPEDGNSEAEQSEDSSDDEKSSKRAPKKSKANAKATPATPLSTSNVNKQATPSTKEKEKGDKKKKDKEKKKKAEN